MSVAVGCLCLEPSATAQACVWMWVCPDEDLRLIQSTVVQRLLVGHEKRSHSGSSLCLTMKARHLSRGCAWVGLSRVQLVATGIRQGWFWSLQSILIACRLSWPASIMGCNSWLACILNETWLSLTFILSKTWIYLGRCLQWHKARSWLWS